MADREPRQEEARNPEKEHEHEQERDLPSTAHAVRLTQSWKPALARRQSWTPEDRKREVLLGVMGAPLPEGYSQVSDRRH